MKEKLICSGASGFIGHSLIPFLAKDYDVYALNRYVTGRRLAAEYADLGVKPVIADLRDIHTVRNVVRRVQPDRVIHLAAISAVSYSFQHPQEVMDTNLTGTINLAEACLKIAHFKQFLYAGTSEMYGNQDINNIPIRETAWLRPNQPYAVSKVAASLYLKYMEEAYRFPVTELRCFNTYGRIRNRHFVVESIVTQMLQGVDTLLLGDPLPVRDFMYRDDHIQAYLTCLDNDKAMGETFNFCTGKGENIKGLVELAKGLTGWEGKVLWDTMPRRPCEIDVLVGDNTKAKRVLGWEPKWTLEKGLKQTIKSIQEVNE